MFPLASVVPVTVVTTTPLLLSDVKVAVVTIDSGNWLEGNELVDEAIVLEGRLLEI